jgi:NTE family protein
LSNRRPKIGVALSGGGVRGFAHLGILRVLEEENVHVDLLAGTSMGGLVAGLYAAGVSLDRLDTFARAAGLRDLISPDRDRRGLIDQDRMAPLLADLLGSAEFDFADLRIPTTLLAVDLERCELVRLTQGPLVPALLATSAFPFVFSPVHHQERWLVDGGVANNLPVDEVRRMGADRVLGVNTPSSFRLCLDREIQSEAQESENAGLVRGLPARARELPALARELPTRARALVADRMRMLQQPFTIMQASMGYTVSMANRTRLALCPPDLLLDVQMPGVGVFTTQKNSEAIDAGYRVAHERRAALRALARPLPPPWRRQISSTWGRAKLAWRVYKDPSSLLEGR